MQGCNEDGSSSNGDIALGKITAQGNIMVDSLNNITNAYNGSGAGIIGNNLTINSNGTLGSADNFITLDLKGTLAATAIKDLYLEQVSDNTLKIQAISSGGDIYVLSKKDMIGYTDPNTVAQGYIRSENKGNIYLTSKEGNIGTETDNIRILNANDDISADDENTVTLEAKQGNINVSGISQDISPDAKVQG